MFLLQKRNANITDAIKTIIAIAAAIPAYTEVFEEFALVSSATVNETVVGTDLDRVVTLTEEKRVKIDCVLALAVVDNVAVGDTVLDIYCVVICDDVVGILLVQLSVVAEAVVGDVAKIAVEGDGATVMADLDLVFTASAGVHSDVVADKVVGVCVVERVRLYSHTYGYEAVQF